MLKNYASEKTLKIAPKITLNSLSFATKLSFLALKLSEQSSIKNTLFLVKIGHICKILSQKLKEIEKFETPPRKLQAFAFQMSSVSAFYNQN